MNYLSAKFTMLSIVSMMFIGCTRQPSADFTTDKTDYTAGETIKLKNTSSDGDIFKWTTPDGQTSNSRDLNYLTDNNQQDANLTFKLEAISKNGKKRDVAVKTVSIKAANGQLMVWTSRNTLGNITVYIDNVNMGTITMYYTTTPTCGANGSVTANVKSGSHTVYATDGLLEWNGTIVVEGNNCNTFQLQ